MVDIRGFQALRFDEKTTGALDTVLTPPYDVISAEERALLAAANPYNMTHLILPEAEGAEPPYEHAARLFARWSERGVLRKDDRPLIYPLRQKFTGPDGVPRTRRSFFALLKLPETNERFILGHERTFDKPVEDRLALLRAARANLEPIFLMYSDREAALATALFEQMEQEAPLLAATTSDGVTQEMWALPMPALAQQHLARQVLYIADGHHRFKTACAYRDEQRAATGAAPGERPPHDYILAGFVAFEEPGLKIFAAHRVLPGECRVDAQELATRLDVFFTRRALPVGAAPMTALDQASARCAMVLYDSHGPQLLVLREEKRRDLVGDDRAPAWQDLDVAVLHRGILAKIMELPETMELAYEKDAARAMTLVDQGEASMAFLLRPTRPEQVRACAEAFEPMPQKSTYYFPKLPSGAVIYPH